MKNREFLMLASDYDNNSHTVNGWFASEKLDGMRCFWDGGISRGILKKNILWANTAKDQRLINEPICTGLWSRYGNVIHAPSWWLDSLPLIPMDGELHGLMKRQELMEIIKRHDAGGDWSKVTLNVFDLVALDSWLLPGKISNPNFTKSFNMSPLLQAKKLATSLEYLPKTTTPFSSKYTLIQRHCRGQAIPHLQEELPFNNDLLNKVIQEKLSEVLSHGGEGLVLRAKQNLWEPYRVKSLLKVKPLNDAEAIIIDFKTGKETDKGSKLLGKIGSLVVKWNNKVFNLSGLNDEERELTGHSEYLEKETVLNHAEYWALNNPGILVPPWVEGKYFKRGDLITFTYRTITKDGMPEEARYLRKRDD